MSICFLVRTLPGWEPESPSEPAEKALKLEEFEKKKWKKFPYMVMPKVINPYGAAPQKKGIHRLINVVVTVARLLPVCFCVSSPQQTNRCREKNEGEREGE